MKVFAPFTPEQVTYLHSRQESLTFHPYTCGFDSNHRFLHVSLNGWTCPDCDYTQDWAIMTACSVCDERPAARGVMIAKDRPVPICDPCFDDLKDYALRAAEQMISDRDPRGEA